MDSGSPGVREAAVDGIAQQSMRKSKSPGRRFDNHPGKKSIIGSINQT
jgi:hypothetical protein